MKVFIFKPDGIGDFVLATGVIRKLADVYGEDQLMICVRSLVVPLAKAQFPKADILELPLLDKRKKLNLFLANLIRATPPWARMLTHRFECSISLRHMREYLHTFMFFSSRASRRVVCENLLLRNQQPTRLRVEKAAVFLRPTTVVEYPEEGAFIPLEFEAHRRVLTAVLGKEVSRSDVQPLLRANPERGDYLVCSPFSTLTSKDYPIAKWVWVLSAIPLELRPPKVILSGAASQVEKLQEMVVLLKAAGFTDVQIEAGGDLQVFVNKVAGAKIVLTVDTAAAHIATALDRPAIILHSGLHYGMFGPWTASARQVWFGGEREDSRKWHQSLSAETVATEASRLLRDA
ncbi:MAG: glycosyltransferase family 9 protein [Chthoniobacterales bacterium]